MSANATPDNAAFEYLHSRVHVPVFFNKLAADYGIRPNGPDEAKMMLDLAGKLRILYDAEQEKQAAAHSGALSKLSSALDKELAKRGLAQAPANSQVVSNEVKLAAAHLMQDPEAVRSVLALQAAYAANQAA